MFLENKLLVFAGVIVWPFPGKLFLLVNVFNFAADYLVSLSLWRSSKVLFEEAASTDLLLSVNILEFVLRSWLALRIRPRFRLVRASTFDSTRR